LLGVVRQQLLAGLGRHGHVFVVVAREQAQLAVIQVSHVGAHAVEEVTVVRNDDHQAGALGQHVFQPADGVDVQVGATNDLLTLRPLPHPVEQRDVVFEVVRVVLGVVTQLCRVGPLDRAGVRGQFIDQRAQQGGFTDTVRADDRHALARFNLEAEVLEQRLAVEALGHLVNDDRLTVQLLVLIKADERAHAARRLDLGQLDLVDRLGAGGSLLGFRGVGREAADERLQLGDLSFLLGVVRQQL
nr:hypothetical protein [Tanacetum cinerariifolium]